MAVGIPPSSHIAAAVTVGDGCDVYSCGEGSFMVNLGCIAAEMYCKILDTNALKLSSALISFEVPSNIFHPRDSTPLLVGRR